MAPDDNGFYCMTSRKRFCRSRLSTSAQQLRILRKSCNLCFFKSQTFEYIISSSTSSIQLCSASRSFNISVDVLPGNCCCCSVTRCEQLINRLYFSCAILWKRSARAAQMRHKTMSWRKRFKRLFK